MANTPRCLLQVCAVIDMANKQLVYYDSLKVGSGLGLDGVGSLTPFYHPLD